MTSDHPINTTGSRQRQTRFAALQKWVSRAFARDLSCLIVPGQDVALAHGLNVSATGMRVSASPRDANVLLIVGGLSEKMGEVATVLYAQMPRPRTILMLGGKTPSSFPDADVSAGLSQKALADAVGRLKRALAEGAFATSAEDFDASVLHVKIEYVCPMHPEVVEDEPGSCPKCGMDLVAREAGEQTPEGGHDHEHRHDHEQQCQDHDHDDSNEHQQEHAHENAATEYTCPMHPEIVRDEPGSCPKCGMDLVVREDGEDEAHSEHEHSSHDHGEHDHSGHEHGGHDHGGHDHGGHDHGASGFMSMIEVTKDLPRSADGLQMDWLEVPFGPVFPGLPGGLKLTLTLDGDGVTEGQATSLVGVTNEGENIEESEEMDAETFIGYLSAAIPLAPVSYRLLVCLAIEQAAGLEGDSANAGARTGALERERIASHLGWLAQLGRQLGFAWLTQRAATLQLQVREANRDSLAALEPALRTLGTRLERTPLLKSRLKGIGLLPTESSDLRGPVARAADEGGDAWARLRQRLAEISASLGLIKSGGEPALPVLRDVGDVSGTGEATVDTPRGEARLSLKLERGHVKSYKLDTACSQHIGLVPKLVEGQELGDALLAVGSLDLSPWEVTS
ncbi:MULTISPECIES: heavy metal-binding domain-containing protein [Marinobacter]|jgi:Ni,Fe-hydrogenase III large subunit|uniref:heavy metal-binding domain-containing protein n=1 Tax=Marinobacter TaxID=2742 RepID=UPI001C8D8389|tara:strand:- start:2805 stop:4670 length:1866 start_codon:yes stop_codon:yes gene_type:complete